MEISVGVSLWNERRFGFSFGERGLMQLETVLFFIFSLNLCVVSTHKKPRQGGNLINLAVSE